MATIAERIREALEISNMKQADLVEKTGIGKSSISTYISGEYEPKQRNIYKLAKALNVNEAWLMGNDVPKERAELKNINTVLTKSQKILLSVFNNLNDLGQAEAIKRVEELNCIHKYTFNSSDNLLMAAERASDYLTLKAAHAIENATEDDKKHDDNIMSDENF